MDFGYQNKIFLLLLLLVLQLQALVAETQVLSLSTFSSNTSVSSSLRGRSRRVVPKGKPVGRRGLLGCDLYKGRWIVDNSYPGYVASSCPYIDSEFDCLKHGRSDTQYLKYAWKPDSCNLPR